MIYRSIHMIFEPSGMPVPSEDEVRFEAREIIQRSGWGLPLIEALRKLGNPYWREAVARCLMEIWNELVRDKNEQTYYYDMDGDVRYCWADAECDFNRIIRRSTAEQVDYEQTLTVPVAAAPIAVPSAKTAPIINNYNYYIENNNAPIYAIEKSDVTLNQQ